MRINAFPGLIQAASPYALPPGAAVEQTNVMSLVPGQLTVRGGSQKLGDSVRAVEIWGWSPGSGKSESILGQTEAGDIVEYSGLGGSMKVEVKNAGAFSGDYPVTFSQGRRGEVYIYQGYGKRGLVRGTDGTVRLVGLDAPKDKPVITIDSTVSYYVARIDIVRAGSGYSLPPAVTVAPPPAGGRQATAIARIRDRALSEITVTDGGAGYTSPPVVRVAKPQKQVADGVAALAALESGAPGGDHKSGVVYWDFYQPSNGGFTCYSDIDGNNLARWRDGYLVPAYGGSGSGAVMYLELTEVGKQWALYGGSGGSSSAPNPAGLPGFPASCPPAADTEYEGAGPTDLWQSWQVYDFGTGYKPGDEVYAYIFTQSVFWAGSCGTLPANQACPVVFKGYVWGSGDTPDPLTIKEDIKYRRARLSEKMANEGSGYLTPPRFIADDGEIIRSEINDNGSVIALHPENKTKTYIWPPEVLDDGAMEGAEAQAIVRANFRGKYQCYYRYVNDSISEESGGPLYSSLSPVNEIDCGEGAKSITWGEVPIPETATAIELWRSTADQATTLFRIAKIGGKDPFGSWVDELSDYDVANPERKGFLAMPILLSDGSLNANRYGVASPDFAVGVVFQDRTFLAVDTTGKRPNTILYSEADEPESMPEVNELILQTNVRDTDYITALIPYAGALVVAQSRHCHRLTFVSDPGDDAQTALIAYRGCINQRTWDIYLGTAYVLDEMGLYAIDERGQVEHLSAALDTMFRTNPDPSLTKIDFSKRRWFFVRADRNLGVIRVHVSFEGDEGKYPARQLVYDPDSKSWWQETYPTAFSSAASVRDDNENTSLVHAGEDGLYSLGVGLTDSGSPIPYSFRTGNIEFITDAQRNGGQAGSRNVSVVYKPTDTESLLKLSLYYNGSKEPRVNVAHRDRGVGFIHEEGEAASYVDMQKMRLEDAESHGIARAIFSGRTLEDIYGSDTHISLKLHGEQTDAGPIVIHSVDLQGVMEAQK
jgi:hypothetical protein